MRRLATIIGVLVLVAWLVSIPAGVYFWWQMEQDVGGNLDRAIQSSNAADMKEYLLEAESGMERWGYTEGHYALIFQTPQNNAALDYQALNRMVERLDKIEEKPEDSTEYQVAIDDIRGTIRDSHWDVYNNWAINRTPIAFMYWFPYLGWLIGGIFIVIGEA